MTKPIQLTMAYCGYAFLGVFFAGLLISGFFPPIPPDNTAAEVVDQYVREADQIRTGCLIMIFAAGLTIPWCAVVSTQLVRVEGRFTPLCFAQLVCGAVGVLAVTVPMLVFSATAFRPDRDPEVTQALNDLAWFLFVMNWPFITAQAAVIAAAILADGRPDPIFPRWVGYLQLWCAVLFIPAGLLTYFKTGPFAWNGLLSFWMAAVAFGVFMLVTTWATTRAVTRQFAPGNEVSSPQVGPRA